MEMNLVQASSTGVPTTTSLIIAEGTENQHGSVLKLVRNNLKDFEEFGPVGFEIRKGKPLPQGGFAKATEYAVLNREHAMLLMTYMRNTPVVRSFKKNLIKAFVVMERRLATPAFRLPQSLPEALRELANVHEQLEAVNAELRPKADYFDEFVADEDLIQFRTLANQLQVKEAELRQILIDHKWIYRIEGNRWSNKKNRIISVCQYRAYANKKHLFRLIPCHEAPRISGEVQQTLKLTPRGAEAVVKAVKKWAHEPKPGIEAA
ncbi:hypothetical protein GP475_08930 [Corynebacterium poyangense]|uniref:Antirepressor protein C-terminal domain-containing protein n=1 Tax=Corynebacterium poyangense TaxID=2684405 RepID=A0A7H0SQC5_9CORY|nr:phage regulatory protein/antirepressor Ant [Corynebacterium poyangense]QNQ90750.1 hypothetical protein GP475_08930 [Corynebacterium poyangense]